MVPGLVQGSITLFLSFLGCTGTMRRLHTMHYFLLASLSLSDLALNNIATFVGVSQICEKWIFGETWCNGTSYLLRGFVFTTIFLLCAVTWECHTAVINPYQFRSNITLKKVIIVVLLWVSPFPLLAGPIFQKGEFVYNDNVYQCDINSKSNNKKIGVFILFFIFFIIPLGLISKQQYQIYRIAKHQKTQIAQQELVLNPSNHEGQQQRRFIQNIKEAKDIQLIVAAFLVSYLLVFVTITLRAYQEESDVLHNTWFLAMALTQAGSVWNPIIYCFRKRAFRRQLLKVLNMNTFRVSPPT